MFITDSPAQVEVYPVQADILAVQLDVGATHHGQQQPYERRPGDRVKDGTWLKRQGEFLGTLVNPKLLYTFDRLVGDPLDPDWVASPDSYRLTSNRPQTLIPSQVHRKTKPLDMARTGPWEFAWPLRHIAYLQLPTDLVPGQTYTLQFLGEALKPVEFTYDPSQQVSEAVHISQVGFHPDDPLKLGYLSLWMGDGGGLDFAEGQTFQLIEEGSNRVAYEGVAVRSKAMDQTEDPRERDYTLTEIHRLDFSDFDDSGRYRLCVETVGCSRPFPVNEQVWQDSFYTAARGLLHQRSGIALEEPFTDYERPRAFHPDDGVTVYQSTAKLMDVDMGIGDEDAFEALVKGKTRQVVEDAWGGYFDAGDWDRRIQHLEVPRYLLELYGLYPDYFDNINLNLPESDNQRADLLDEALWSLDFYRRLQADNGGISGGIESAEHPRMGETSWQESLTVMAYAPDMWSSYLYAGVAARAAYWLEKTEPQLASTYRDSALRAMAYAEAAYAQDTQERHHSLDDARNLAALELFRLTEDEGWHALFLETTVFQDSEARVYVWDSHRQKDAAFLYSRLSQGRLSRRVQQNAWNALMRDAQELGQLAEQTGFGWTKTELYEPIGWGNSMGTPKTTALIRAHVLTGEQTYLTQIIRATQFTLGANPSNMAFTTGLGHHRPQNPLIIDARIMGSDPPPGITVYGPMDTTIYEDYWILDLLADQVYPSPWDWPTVENYFDVYLYPPVTEFTVMQSMKTPAYTWGYLAAYQVAQQP